MLKRSQRCAKDLPLLMLKRNPMPTIVAGVVLREVLEVLLAALKMAMIFRDAVGLVNRIALVVESSTRAHIFLGVASVSNTSRCGAQNAPRLLILSISYAVGAAPRGWLVTSMANQ